MLLEVLGRERGFMEEGYSVSVGEDEWGGLQKESLVTGRLGCGVPFLVLELCPLWGEICDKGVGFRVGLGV